MVQGQHEKGITTIWKNTFITYISPKLHALKILRGHKEERHTDSEMAPQCSPASRSETPGV